MFYHLHVIPRSCIMNIQCFRDKISVILRSTMLKELWSMQIYISTSKPRARPDFACKTENCHMESPSYNKTRKYLLKMGFKSYQHLLKAFQSFCSENLWNHLLKNFSSFYTKRQASQTTEICFFLYLSLWWSHQRPSKMPLAVHYVFYILVT